MSIVCAGYEPGEGMWIGADTQGTQNDFIGQFFVDKWIVSDYWALAITGQVRALDLVKQHANKILKSDTTPYNIANTLYREFTKLGFKDVSPDNACPSFGQWIILVNPGRIFSIGPDFSVSEVDEGFYAEGCGCEYAWGVHYALRDKPAKIQVKTAIEAACKYNIYCGGDIRMQLLSE